MDRGGSSYREFGRVGVPEGVGGGGGGGSWGNLTESVGSFVVSDSSGGSWGLQGSPRRIWGHPEGVAGVFIGSQRGLGALWGFWGLSVGSGGIGGGGRGHLPVLIVSFVQLFLVGGEAEGETGEVRPHARLGVL